MHKKYLHSKVKCRYFCRLTLDISPVYLTRGISIALRSTHRFLHLTLTVIFSCGRLQIAYNQRAYTKCYPNIFLSVYIHVNTKTAFSFFQYLHTSLFVFAYPQQPRLLLFVYKFQILLQKQSYSFHDS